jgi:uncharacterized protein (DUF1697 family)
MKTYISLLRGINVSGQKSIKMIDLQILFETIGFINVKTYIQSGNVIFKSKLEVNEVIEDIIQKELFKKFGFLVPVIVRSIDEMIEVIDNNPFLKQTEIDYKSVYISFLSEKPNQKLIDNAINTSYLPEIFHIINKEVYLFCPIGYGKTKLSNTFFENKMKVQATTRNWNSTNKLIEMAKDH